MEAIILQRRSFILGAALSLITAPAIVRAASIMPVRSFLDVIGIPDDSLETYLARYRAFQKEFLNSQYRKITDPKEARDVEAGQFGAKWAGDHFDGGVRRGSTSARALADDGQWNIHGQRERIAADDFETKPFVTSSGEEAVYEKWFTGR